MFDCLFRPSKVCEKSVPMITYLIHTFLQCQAFHESQKLLFFFHDITFISVNSMKSEQRIAIENPHHKALSLPNWTLVPSCLPYKPSQDWTLTIVKTNSVLASRRTFFSFAEKRKCGRKWNTLILCTAIKKSGDKRVNTANIRKEVFKRRKPEVKYNCGQKFLMMSHDTISRNESVYSFLLYALIDSHLHVVFLCVGTHRILNSFHSFALFLHYNA